MVFQGEASKVKSHTINGDNQRQFTVSKLRYSSEKAASAIVTLSSKCGILSDGHQSVQAELAGLISRFMKG